jgi:hypothetical protein
MFALFVVGMLQAAPCSSEAAQALDRAAAQIGRFDLTGAITALDQAAERGCSDGAVAATFLRGWSAARDAYAEGGSPAALAPVNAAIRLLSQEPMARGPHAELAGVLLLAAAAAAQSEREDMITFLEHALSLEERGAGGKMRSFVLSVAEAAGDLWLQVHRFEAAGSAYREAAKRRTTPAVSLGLARVAARMDDTGAACAAYRALLESWGAASSVPQTVEASEYVTSPRCAAR